MFLTGLDDAAEQLCRANMAYGIAKIHHVEERLGLDPGAMFIGAPDATVTRNSYRWRQGFGYGGQISWSSALAVLDSKPNGCGMMVGAPTRLPDEATVREAARAARDARLTLDGVELIYDLGESNHFVDVLELEQVLEPWDQQAHGSPPDQLFVIHSSGHEHRARSPYGPGLYIDESDELRRMAQRVETPWGPLSVLQGEEAQLFHDFCARVQEFNRLRRRLYGEQLFGQHTEVCNATHQGMRAPGTFHLGAYWFEKTDQLYPLTLGPDQPVYLVRPKPNLSEEVIHRLGWHGRALAQGVLDRLAGANLLPHGGGYSFPQLEGVLRVEDHGDHRTFWLQPSVEGPPLQLEDARALPFAYRDLAVLRRLVDLELAVPVARYRILYVVKE
jgi:hypothetical protein